ncbi:MAG: ArsJ-associated glyceraldehyde-3-phosphate dehydrogenase [Magnetovibrionaceae bacterium]
MSLKIGINGFGRMGRLSTRVALDTNSTDQTIEIVHINEPGGTAEVAAHLLAFDTVHGRWPHEISNTPHSLTVDGRTIPFTQESTIGAVDWKAAGCDIVLECSGKFRTTETLQTYFDQGVAKVIVAAPVKEGALNIVMGCNDHLYEPETHHLVTAASCTTNCLAPVVKVLHEEIGITHGLITTIHDVTNTQVMVDGPQAAGKNDLRRARSGLNSLIPTSTGSATAITKIYPELTGRLNGIAVRVPLLNASITDAVFEVSAPTTVEDVNELFRSYAKGELKGILGFEEKPLVSADYTNDPRSGIVDGPATIVTDGTMVKVIAWYDNEWGYVNRMVELARKVGAAL